MFVPREHDCSLVEIVSQWCEPPLRLLYDPFSLSLLLFHILPCYYSFCLCCTIFETVGPSVFLSVAFDFRVVPFVFVVNPWHRTVLVTVVLRVFVWRGMRFGGLV